MLKKQLILHLQTETKGDKKVFSGPNNLKYYMIDFDGEIEFAL